MLIPLDELCAKLGLSRPTEATCKKARTKLEQTIEEELEETTQGAAMQMEQRLTAEQGLGANTPEDGEPARLPATTLLPGAGTLTG